MLDAKDLRIGNLILVHNHYVATIERIGKDIGVKTYGEKISQIDYIELQYLTPIELTDEWLLRFGLIKDNGYPYKFLDGFIKMRNGEYFFKYHNLDIKLNYVHNLQNLHYIFTQTELTLKDEK